MNKVLSLLITILIWTSVGWGQEVTTNAPLIPASTQLQTLREKLVELINQNRKEAGLNPVELDPLASQVGDRHCQEMIQEGYFSHWNRQGLKPYMRYAQAGGVDALKENLSSSEGGALYILERPERLASSLEAMHLSMFNEKAPNDGHRQTILYPYLTHVGIGIAFNESRLTLAEEFTAHYAELKPLPKTIKTGKLFTIEGRVLDKGLEVIGISIYHEQPEPLTIEQLNQLRSYGFPDTEAILRPYVTNQLYSDGTPGEIYYNRSTGKFSCKLSFVAGKKGIYTIVVWVKRGKEKFPVTNISIEGE